MKKKIAILGSTGSIGSFTLDILQKNISKFSVELLSANKNYKKIIKQAKKFKVKNVIIYDKRFYEIVKRKLSNNKTKVFCGEVSLNKIIKNKLDYTMSAIVGIAGLKPTIEAVKMSKVLAIANKESIICGWDVILREKKKYNTKIIPVDSEHFSINELTKNCENSEIEEIIITASGGPFLKTSLKKIKNIKPREAIKHPNWKMGKKISIDSANLMNKVFEIIEASKLFNFSINKYRIFIHPQSYVHSIIKFKNGLVKMILHDTDMKIPISNSIYGSKINNLKVKKISEKYLNKLKFYKVDKKRFPSVRLIDQFKKNGNMHSIIMNAANEELVSLFLKNKIKFIDIVKLLNKMLHSKEINKYAKKKPKTVDDIYKCDQWARLKTHAISVQ